MNGSRYTVLIILVLLFSWPVLLQKSFSPWFIWLYPFAIWFLLIIFSILVTNKASQKSQENTDKTP